HRAPVHGPTRPPGPDGASRAADVRRGCNILRLEAMCRSTVTTRRPVMKRSELNRRRFLRQASLGTVGVSVAAGSAPAPVVPSGAATGTLAVLGGKPVRTGSFPSWPVAGTSDADAVRAVAESRRWSRLSGNNVNTFEKVLAQRLGARHCTVTSSGTTSLLS